MQLSVYSGQRIILSSWPQEVLTGWHANERKPKAEVLSTSHSLRCYDYIMCFRSVDRFIIYLYSRSSYLYHVIIGPPTTSCYDFLSPVPGALLELYQQFNPVIILDQQIHLLTHRFMFLFFFFLSHLFHVRSLRH